jgi:glutathione S-transferase
MDEPTVSVAGRFRRSRGSLVAMLFHLAAADEWRAGEPYRRSMPGVPLDDVGFVHCSYESQVAATAALHYAGRTDLVLLTIDPERLTSEVRVEDGFPHVYGAINADAVVESRRWA